mmetsp:Transcript_123272/g.343215  ORF Transcript_123272/g.343215 Transcript_123272/m.343215 type:complete len:311 (-) Transcript_123272:854-1786(-)
MKSVRHPAGEAKAAHGRPVHPLGIEYQQLRGCRLFPVRVQEEVAVILVAGLRSLPRDEGGLPDVGAGFRSPDARPAGEQVVLQHTVEHGHASVRRAVVKGGCIAVAEGPAGEIPIDAGEVAWHLAEQALLHVTRPAVEPPLREPLLVGVLHIHVHERHLRHTAAHYDEVTRSVLLEGVHHVEAGLAVPGHRVPLHISAVAEARQHPEAHGLLLVERHRSLAFEDVLGFEHQRTVHDHRVVLCDGNVVCHDAARHWYVGVVDRLSVLVPHAVLKAGIVVAEPDQLTSRWAQFRVSGELTSNVNNAFRLEIW